MKTFITDEFSFFLWVYESDCCMQYMLLFEICFNYRRDVHTVAPKIDRTAHTIFVHHCFFVNGPALRETVFIIVSAMVSCLI